MESILTSIKKLLGMGKEYTAFDTDIIMYINSALMSLRQLGIGPAEGFRIKSDLDTWARFLGEREDIEAVKTYVYIKVRLVFDPPQSSAAIAALKEELKEQEFRLGIEVDE